jgi:hypothetical protein
MNIGLFGRVAPGAVAVYIHKRLKMAHAYAACDAGFKAFGPENIFCFPGSGGHAATAFANNNPCHLTASHSLHYCVPISQRRKW